MIRGKAVKRLEEEGKRKKPGGPWEETAMALSGGVLLGPRQGAKGLIFS